MKTLPTSAFLLLLVLSAGPAQAADSTISTAAGTGKAANNGDAGPAIKTNVAQPFGVEIGPDGALYITEVGTHRVRRVDLTTGKMTTVAGTGKQGYRGDGGAATAAELNEPYEVRFDRDGNMYFVEMKNHLIRRVDKKTGIISTLAGTGKAGYGGDGGPAIQARFRSPHSIALDHRGGLYVADIGNHRIRRVDLKSGIVTTVAGTGKKELPTDGQVARGRPILGPRALFIDKSSLWIALREGHSIWRMDLGGGTLHHVAGTGRRGFGGDGGPAKNARFNGPKGIAIGPRGNVYVVDTENQAIRMIDLAKQTIHTVAGAGPAERGGKGDGGPATKAQLDRPHGICVAKDGTVYIGDTNNHRVRQVRTRRNTPGP